MRSMFNPDSGFRTRCSPGRAVLLLIALVCNFVPAFTIAQNRDFHAERIIIDDNGDDGTRNAMTIRTSDSLTRNVILTIPDPGTDSARFMLVSPGTSGPWSLNGNAGTTPGTDYLGTSDASPVHLYANGGGSNALLLNTNWSIQRGLSGEARGIGAVDLQYRNDPSDPPADSQVASGLTATIGGGMHNAAAGTASTVGGGEGNTSSGLEATVSGGNANTASDAWATVGGGRNNFASGEEATVGGGSGNSAAGSETTVGGGSDNSASGISATIAGGRGGEVASSYGTIGGGSGNSIGNSLYATIAGGHINFIDGSQGGTIGGGENNRIDPGGLATISGGANNAIRALYGTVGGGRSNSIRINSPFATIAGGDGNIVDTVNGGTIGGGVGNRLGASATQSTIAGGSGNTIGTGSVHTTISGGGGNTIGENASGGVISGGSGNALGAGARMSAIPGGRGLTLNGAISFGYLANNGGDRNMTVSDQGVSVLGNTDLWLANNDGSARGLRFYEAETDTGIFPSGTHYTSLEAGDQTTDINYVLPTAAPTSNGQVLASTTGGMMSWADGPTGAQSFSNAGAATPTLALENNAGADNGTALFISEGTTILSHAQGAPASIPNDISVFNINDGVGGSAPVVGQPTGGANGQLLYIYVSDPDGSTVGGVGGLGGAFRAAGSRLTYVYVNGGWQLFHVN